MASSSFKYIIKTCIVTCNFTLREHYYVKAFCFFAMSKKLDKAVPL